MIMPLAYYKVLKSEGLAAKIRYLLIAVVFMVNMVNTQTRSGMMAVVVSSAVFLGFSKLWNRRNAVVIGGILIIICCINMFIDRNNNWEILLSKMSITNYSNNDRISIYESSLSAIKENLWIGSGYEAIHKRTGSDIANMDRAHNEILQQLMAYGIFGLCAYFYLVYCYCRDTWEVYRYIPGCRLLIVVLFSCCLSYFVFVQFNPSHIPISTVFWTLLGATYGVKNLR